MYKEIGNSIYGLVVRGMSDKRKFDNNNKTGQTIRMKAHYLTKPILTRTSFRVKILNFV